MINILFAFFHSLDVIDDADIAAHKPYVRPEPVRIPVYKEEIEKRPGVEVPEDQIFKVVEFNGSFARLKCMRNPVATPSPPQTPPPQSPPPIPMPEEGDQQCESSQVGTSRQLRTKIEPPNMFFSHMKPPKRVLLQMTAPRMVLLQVRTPKVEAPKGVPLLVVPLLVIPPKIVRRHADAPKGDPSQQAVPSQQKGINILRPQKVPLQINTPNKVLFQVKPPKIVPPQGLPRPQRDIPQPAVDGDKPPIQKVVMVRLLDNDSGLPSSSTVMNQHDYARPSTSRGTMAKEELEDIHASKYLIF